MPPVSRQSSNNATLLPPRHGGLLSFTFWRTWSCGQQFRFLRFWASVRSYATSGCAFAKQRKWLDCLRNALKLRTSSPRLSLTSLRTYSFICAGVLLCGILTGCSQSIKATKAQGDILRANPVYIEGGARVVPLKEAGVTYTFEMPIYVLPESAYRALMLTPTN